MPNTPVSRHEPSPFPPLLALAAVLAAFELHLPGDAHLDLAFQNLLYLGHDRWIVDSNNLVVYMLFYRLPKYLAFAIAAVLIARVVRPAPTGPFAIRRNTGYVLLCFALVPLACSTLRALTHLPSPWQVVQYGGTLPFVLLFEPRPANYECAAFPAVHASGGFALLALGWCFERSDPRRWKFGWVVGIVAGTVVGGYQMARGVHFLSQTLATACLAWLICVLLARAIRPVGLRPVE